MRLRCVGGVPPRGPFPAAPPRPTVLSEVQSRKSKFLVGFEEEELECVHPFLTALGRDSEIFIHIQKHLNVYPHRNTLNSRQIYEDFCLPNLYLSLTAKEKVPPCYPLLFRAEILEEYKKG